MKEKKIKNGITYVILGIVGVVMLFPVIWMFFACFKTNNEIFGSLSLLPQGWSPEAFIKGWKTTGTYTYAQYFINTFALVVPTTLLTLVSCSIVAYGFARFDFPGNQFLFMVLIATLMLPNAIIIIPRYALFNKLGWLDSYMTFYAPAAVGCYPFFVFMRAAARSSVLYRFCCPYLSRLCFPRACSSFYGPGMTFSTPTFTLTRFQNSRCRWPSG